MDLNEQADEAVNAVRDHTGVILSDATRSLARLTWLDGYQAGAAAARERIAETFTAWQAEQS